MWLTVYSNPNQPAAVAVSVVVYAQGRKRRIRVGIVGGGRKHKLLMTTIPHNDVATDTVLSLY